jgi:flagellar basal-body rod protein FlgG
MAIIALNSAATGLRALSDRIDVVANNLANAETQAFKRQNVNFEDLMYLHYKQPGTTDAQGDMAPAGITVGLGTKISNTELDMTEGPLDNTGNPLDVAIEGDGFFHVKILPTISGGDGYTRSGSLIQNANGDLVVAIGAGYELVPPINIPKGSTNIAIGQDGTVSYSKSGTNTISKAGQIMLSQFVNPQGLRMEGGSIYTVTDASGPAIVNTPGDNGAGTLQSGYTEESNVDAVKELVTLIKTQRSFELNSQSIQTADQALQTIANLKRS